MTLWDDVYYDYPELLGSIDQLGGAIVYCAEISLEEGLPDSDSRRFDIRLVDLRDRSTAPIGICGHVSSSTVNLDRLLRCSNR